MLSPGLYQEKPESPLSYEDIIRAVRQMMPKEQADETAYFLYLIARAD